MKNQNPFPNKSAHGETEAALIIRQMDKIGELTKTNKQLLEALKYARRSLNAAIKSCEVK